ncbi:dihydropyrimidinase [bacterium]|nr:dihydropyrimidinase [candidate division CSSED10-310 bacterium]
MDLIVRGGRVVLEQGSFDLDVGIADGRIAALSAPGGGHARDEINVSGCFVMPGFIDAHTHFKLPFCGTVTADDFRSGTRAAAMGGVTTIIDFANPPAGGAILAPVRRRLGEMVNECHVDYSVHASACGMCETSLDEFEQVVAMGVTSLKLFMTYRREGRITHDGWLFKYLEKARELDALITVHAENDEIIAALIEEYRRCGLLSAPYHGRSRPSFSEAEAIARACAIAGGAGGRLHIVHMTTAGGATAVERARIDGVRVTCETCPQYLVLDESRFAGLHGHRYATCPPLRPAADVEGLWRGIETGVVDMVATDHCVFTAAQKDAWGGDFTAIPYGIPGVETMAPVFLEASRRRGGLPQARLVSMLSTNPARIFGLYPRKGSILPGADADIVVLDPRVSWRIDPDHLATPCDWSPYTGYQVTGRITHVLLRGGFLVRDGEFIDDSRRGMLLPRAGGTA